MEQLARRLTDVLGRHVIDKTGFTGTFDLHLNFAFDDRVQVPRRSAEAPEATAPSGLPSIFTALRNQLGLKLESSKGLIDVLVIDRKTVG